MSRWELVFSVVLFLAGFGFVMDRIEKRLNRIIELLERERR